MINLDPMIGILYYRNGCIEYPMNRGSPSWDTIQQEFIECGTSEFYSNSLGCVKCHQGRSVARSVAPSP